MSPVYQTKEAMSKYFVYILECEHNKLYTGITTDVERRFREHREGKGGRFTRAIMPLRIAYKEGHLSRSAALKREAQIKRLRREQKLDLIRSKNQPQYGWQAKSLLFILVKITFF